MEGRKIKDTVIYGIYIVSFILILASIYLMGLSSNSKMKSEDTPNKYVSKSIFDNTVSVVSQTKNFKFIKPVTREDITIKKTYYDKDSDEKEQENAIIYYENTYMQSTGILYTSNTNFDVSAVYDGTVTEIKEDDLLGKTIVITHENGMSSIYQSLSEVKVNQNDQVKQGDIIASSGVSNLFKDDENSLYFEMVNDGKNINPLLCYDKTISEIKG